MDFHRQVAADLERGLCELEIADKHQLTVTELRNKVASSKAAEAAANAPRINGRVVGANILMGLVVMAILYRHFSKKAG